MKNIAHINPGIIAVSRDCFPTELSARRKKVVLQKAAEKKIELTDIETIVESEKDVPGALREMEDKKVNTLIIYLGNFGPEISTSLLAKRFQGPVMMVAAAEESGNDLVNGRGDAYCGLLSASYNCGLKKAVPFIPEYPVGVPDEIAAMIGDFLPVARIILSLKRLKIFSFGPRPHDFVACNAPIKPLYDLGIEIMENSELDLYDIYRSAENDPRIPDLVNDMRRELKGGNTYPGLLAKLARYEIALMNFFEENLGACDYGIFANKCWPSFEKYFWFVPCYVNSRLALRGIPVSCEVDIYGALSEYILTCAGESPATILDINNTVPRDLIEKEKTACKQYKSSDLFMGFHCGNTPSCFICDPKINYQRIMHRLMEPGKEPDITRGTLEGRMLPGDVTIFRLQSTADTRLKAYCAQGEVLPLEPHSFGSIGVIGITEMGRFYRHVLIENRFPHHTALTYKHLGKYLFGALGLLGVRDIYYNKPAGDVYVTENPFH
ncbi:MAG: fucose isomerase [Spirochaetales bacterium]|nr:fucose isomerase [Spirochaetales bacterium]